MALFGGLIGAAINATRPNVEYGVDLTKTVEFEHLYWDVFSYAMTKLHADSLEAISEALSQFAQRMAETAAKSGGSTATAS